MLKDLWNRYWTWRDNEGKIVHTIVIARVKLAIGTIYMVMLQSGVDFISFIHDEKYKIAAQVFMAWLAIDGTLTEWGRRHAADDMK